MNIFFDIPYAFLAVMFFIPILLLFRYAVWDTGGLNITPVTAVLGSPIYWKSLWQTFGLAATTSIFCLIFGYPVAYWLARSHAATKFVLIACLLLPFWTSSLVRAFAWIGILGRKGPVNAFLLWSGLTDRPLQLIFNSFAVHVGTIQIMLPYMVFSLYAVMGTVERSTALAAESCGARPARGFWLGYFPQTVCGMISGLILTFVLSIGFFVTPAVLGGQGMTPYVVHVERNMNEFLNWPVASALSMVLILATIGAYMALNRIARSGVDKSGIDRSSIAVFRLLQWIDQTSAKALPAALVRATGYAMLWIGRSHRVIASLILAFMILPIAYVVLLAFSPNYSGQPGFTDLSLRWFQMYFERQEWMLATLNSLIVATLVALFGIVLALLMAISIRRRPQLAERILSAAMIPTIVPSIVYGVAAYLFFVHLGLTGTLTGIILCHIAIGISPALILIHAMAQRLDPRLEDAAASLGATRLKTLWHVLLPLLMPAVASGALLMFLISFDDLGIVLFMSDGHTMTLPRKIFDSIQLESDPRVVAASALLIGVSTLGLCIFGFLRHIAERRATTGAP